MRQRHTYLFDVWAYCTKRRPLSMLYIPRCWPSAILCPKDRQCPDWVLFDSE